MITDLIPTGTSLPRPRISRGLALPLLALTLAACNTTIDDAKVETAISEGIQTQTGLVANTVICPEDQKIEEGNTFTCKVTLEGGQSFDAEVTQTDDEGNIRWDAQKGLESLNGLISNAALEEQIAQGISEQLQVETSADCGGKFRIALTGETFECTVTDVQGNEQRVQVEAKDDEGNVYWELQ
ncbi:DUF4333 domain-containing protein [Lyngbya confervoides]|uniref:DUF4333 domain-containing protein n=1 Tax=Lyngbya confervoides BDU141951 TaxID=1574623 RepID=A0ABD4T2H7_9CYAN|nr:DUF4333 domain-containing protein [Lyngbya confervoides]MCM1982729.1 DUF4333 domain-containing protein [Lyngbya confervoides BDU141951]